MLQRYYYYIDKGIKSEMLAPQPDMQLRTIESMIPENLLSSTELSQTKVKLDDEVTADYELSLRKSIGKTAASRC